MRAAGCHRAQGFLLARPTPLRDAETVLFRRPPAGYESLEDVWADPLIAALELSDEAKMRLGLRRRRTSSSLWGRIVRSNPWGKARVPRLFSASVDA